MSDVAVPESTGRESHLVAYEAAQRGTVRAWRCKRCPGVWDRWADISGPCAIELEIDTSEQP